MYNLNFNLLKMIGVIFVVILLVKETKAQLGGLPFSYPNSSGSVRMNSKKNIQIKGKMAFL